MLGEIRAMQVYTMTKKISKNICIALYFIGIKSCYGSFFYAGSQIRAVQIHAMRNRASRGMTVLLHTQAASYFKQQNCLRRWSMFFDQV